MTLMSRDGFFLLSIIIKSVFGVKIIDFHSHYLGCWIRPPLSIIVIKIIVFGKCLVNVLTVSSSKWNQIGFLSKTKARK